MLQKRTHIPLRDAAERKKMADNCQVGYKMACTKTDIALGTLHCEKKRGRYHQNFYQTREKPRTDGGKCNNKVTLVAQVMTDNGSSSRYFLVGYL